MLRYKYTETDKIKNMLIEVEALKIVFSNLKILPQVEENLRRESLLNSSVYSARVEGNPSLPSNFQSSEHLHKLEINNLLNAYKFIYSKKCPKKLSILLIKKLHKKVMKNISSNSGSFRNEPWAVYNQAGIAIYIAPLHRKITEMMNELILLEKGLKIKPIIKAAILQFLFEKIHPFADGNGRVGRLITSFVMNKSELGFKGLVSSEVAIDEERSGYYESLEPSSNATGFVEFYIGCFIKEAKKMLEKASSKNEILPEDLLIPRRREIYEIVKDHPYASFDFVARRFLKVNPKTLHFDITSLMKEGFIHKIGKTRGVTYLINKEK